MRKKCLSLLLVVSLSMVLTVPLHAMRPASSRHSSEYSFEVLSFDFMVAVMRGLAELGSARQMAETCNNLLFVTTALWAVLFVSEVYGSRMAGLIGSAQETQKSPDMKAA